MLEIIERLNPWWSDKKFDSGLSRDRYMKVIKDYLKTREMVILTGVRRSGKTTLLYQTVKYLIEEKRIDAKQILFVNFDEADISAIDNPIKSILDIYYQEVCEDSKQAYLIFDEIQSVDGWERWAKTIYDQKKHYLILSGSSSGLLDSRLATLISGRYLKVNVFPLDFREYLSFNELGSLKSNLDLVSNKNKILKLMKDYMSNGAFPRVALQGEINLKVEYLKNYYEGIIYRDIVLMHNVRNTKVMKELLYYLLSNFTSQYSYKKLSEMLKIDFATVKEYLGYIAESRLLFELSLFSYSLKVQNRNNKKVYCIDNGLRNAVSFKFSKDEGKLAENLVFIELKRQDKDIYYWNAQKSKISGTPEMRSISKRNKGEVDFVIKNSDQSLTAINVSYTDKPEEREINALLEFKNEFKKTRKSVLITRDLEQEKHGITFIPLWRWLLQ